VRRALPAFILLYATIYAAFGVASPFWPLFFERRGLQAEQLGILLGLWWTWIHIRRAEHRLRVCSEQSCGTQEKDRLELFEEALAWRADPLRKALVLNPMGWERLKVVPALRESSFIVG
jgi:hypothetical protein